ncbi:hypothetical protein DICPUDRAFT_159092 [Dictyostelium purpureum]|uniref:EGF-like domain-containing protein n=1 Tax=Dictyostelium purpureum TaxID=5786 RepID=F1A396_DICPU|nr:uncharacterized protein DICPUDRAFT_159092 [Dictyostelium purpureum]EGC29336.1 hypothetical protein DICPUDRAFT_159092 [Dictyostelium purpureum]|eukprot:XP_003294139.1 hypothetical protein DICPUDRAFT_159092 [Dictyostelium purpureum]
MENIMAEQIYHGDKISLDTFRNVRKLELLDYTGGDQTVNFVDPTIQTSYQREISVFSKNLPNLKLISNVDTMAVDLQNGFDSDSIENYKGYSDIKSRIEIKSNDINTCVSPKILDNGAIMSVRNLKFQLCFSELTDKIDLANLYPNLQTIEILSELSFIHQQFQFSSVPSSLSMFKMTNSSFGALIHAYNLLINVPTVDISFNQIADQVLPVYPNDKTNGIYSLDLRNNKLTGSLDQSYCKINKLIIMDNSLDGFTNVDMTSIQKSCFGKVIPRLRIDGNTNRVFMEGQNLGFDPSRITTNPQIQWSLDLASTRLSSDFSKYKDIYTLFKIKFEIPELEFTLRATPIQFIVTEYTSFSANSTIIFKGSDFTYDILTTKVVVDNYDCDVSSTTFSTLVCTISDPAFDGKTKDLSGLITNITITKPDKSIFYLQFTTSFSSTGPLTVQVIPCPNQCSQNGICYSNGECKCNLITYDKDCKQGTDCDGSCNSGHCDYKFGTCVCPPNWTGPYCLIPVHSVSSIEPCTTLGGNITIHGWFSTQHEKLTVKIGSLDCEKPYANETTIQCVLGAGSGTKDLNITQNGIVLFSKNKFQYIIQVHECPNNCTSSRNGVCDSSTGICNCFNQWSGYDCSLLKQTNNTGSTSGGGSNVPGSTTTVGQGGTTVITNQDTNYEISIISLVEFDITGKEIKTFDLKKQWNVTVNREKNLYTFTQNLTDSKCIITYTVEEVKTGSKDFEFAGIKFSIDQGGIKLAVNISNYQYTSSLNSLQLRILSETVESGSGECNQVKSESDVSNVDPNQTLNYISLKKNNKQMNGRFINKVVSDNRVTYMSTEVVKELSNSTNIVMGLNLPNCLECLIDPDFSLLVSPNYKSECDSKSNWFLPVVIAVPVGGFAVILITSIILYKKYKYSIKLLMNSSIKMKEKN